MRRTRTAMVLFASLVLLPAPPAAAADVVSAFQTIRVATTWPVQSTSTDSVTSTFGPRIRVSTSAYDWHRGIDIDAPDGTPVYAAADGELWNVTTYPDGGLTVVLRHSFPSAVTYAGKTLSYYYTFYMHLSAVEQPLLNAEAAGQHPVVLRGDRIAAVGRSGSAVDSHLHFEVRVGTQCSLEFQLANPTSSCAGWGFDPAMHSLLLFVPLPSGQQLQLLQAPTNKKDGQVRYSCADDAPLLNRVEVTITEKRNGKVVKSHVLDFNQRTGFDATSTAALDTPDTGKPYMSPLPFGTSPTYQTDVIVPKSFAGKYSGASYRTTLKAVDIWGGATSVSW